MTGNDKPIIDRDTLPFVAPCRIISPLAPFGWLRRGVADSLASPKASIGYGLVMAGIMAFVSALAWIYGTHWFMFAMIGGFVFLAPLAMPYLHAGGDAGDHQHAAISSDS